MSIKLNELKKRAKFAREYMGKRMCEFENEKRRKEYIAQQKEMKESPEYIRNATVRKMLQDVAVVENKAFNIMLKQIDEMVDEIYNLIKETLGYEVKDSKEISFNEIEHVFNQCMVAIKKLRALSEDEKVLSKAGNKKLTAFEKLINNLIELDSRFAVFGTKKNLDQKILQMKLSLLPTALKKDIEMRREKLSIDDKADYVNEHIVCEFEPDDTMLKVNEIMKKVEDAETEAISEMAKATVKLKTNLFDFITTELNLSEGKSTNCGEIEKVFGICLNQLQFLRKLCKNPYIAKNMNWEFVDEYDDLFRKLIDVDVHFALFASKNALTMVGINYNLLNEEEKELMFAKLVRYGLVKDKDLIVEYKKYFANQFKKEDSIVNNKN